MRKRIFAVTISAVMLLSLVTGCGEVTVDGTNHRYTYEQAVDNLDKLYSRVSNMSFDDPSIYDSGDGDFWFAEEDTSVLLPDFFIGRQAVVDENRNDSVTAIVVSSTEKAVNNSTDRWLIDVTEAYNKSDSRKGSIRLYGVASGEAFDYIRSGLFIPDGWTPSVTLWGEALGLVPYAERLAGNVAGIVSKTGATIEEVVAGVEQKTLNFGYTNPFASSVGVNFLLGYINQLRNADSFSDFQRNIALVSYTTPQMRSAALSGKLDAFVYESQQFATGIINEKTGEKLSDLYQFVPFGKRHDNPMYILNDSKRELLEDFTQFCLSAENQRLAETYGFNQYDDYTSDAISGETLLADQAHYKENKSGGRPIVSVFVCDVSGSMNGTPLNELKESLRSCAGVISPENYVSLVTFASDVTVNLPIARFDDKSRSRFVEATSQMVTRGATAMYSGVVVASQLIAEHKEANPDLDAIYRIFVLTDGENTEGLTKTATTQTLQSLGVPIYCIGYNDGSSDLDELAGLNEAAVIKINDQNVGYALANFFKAEF